MTEDSKAAGRPSGKVVAVVSLHVKADRLDEFLGLLHRVLDAMRLEPTFINAVMHADPADPTRIMLYETWADLDDLATVQVKRAYRQDYERRLPELLREPRQFQLWRPLRGDFSFFGGPG